MALMMWSKHFITGIDSIDAQHKGLVNLINAAAPYLAEIGDAPARDVRPLLDRLAKYAVSHFRHEENLMLAGGIDPKYLAQHQYFHSMFSHDVTQMICDTSADSNVSGADLLRFLTSWLTFHILAEDKSMARQLLAINKGASAEEALAMESASEESSANTAVVEALINLFGLVSQRNKILVALNTQLGLAKLELAHANEQLEARVVERTNQLRQTNEELEREHRALLESLAQLQQAQLQLLQADKMASVGQLAAGVAHEINNPISFVNSNLVSLKGQVEDLLRILAVYKRAESALAGSEDHLAAIKRAKASADFEFIQGDIANLIDESLDGVQRVTRIVDNLKDFARADTAEWQFADLEHGLESTLNIACNEIKNKADVEKHYAGLPEIECIGSQINQVFLSLIVNAAQSIEGHGTITLRTGFDEKQVWVEIGDNGTGIKPEHLNKIFEPFFTTKPVGQGTGLGLSLAYGIIKRHHGQLEVRSELGKGTVFLVTLPRVKVVAEANA
jgi:two-component system, NtrC family, sensor kinase